MATVLINVWYSVLLTDVISNFSSGIPISQFAFGAVFSGKSQMLLTCRGGYINAYYYLYSIIRPVLSEILNVSVKWMNKIIQGGTQDLMLEFHNIERCKVSVHCNELNIVSADREKMDLQF